MGFSLLGAHFDMLLGSACWKHELGAHFSSLLGAPFRLLEALFSRLLGSCFMLVRAHFNLLGARRKLPWAHFCKLLGCWERGLG